MIWGITNNTRKEIINLGEEKCIYEHGMENVVRLCEQKYWVSSIVTCVSKSSIISGLNSKMKFSNVILMTQFDIV